MSSIPAAVDHVFVLMLENHSFDNVFAMSGIEGIQVANLTDFNSYGGTQFFVRDRAPWAMTTDPGHEFKDVLEQLCGAELRENYRGGPYPEVDCSGFASSYATSTSESTGRPKPEHIGDIMACFHTPTQLPVINQLAREFAIADQWFSSIPGPTWPNRFFLHGASSAGWADSPSLAEELPWETFKGFRYENGSIFEALTRAGRKWRLYNDRDNQFSDDPSAPWFGGWISQVASLHGISQFDVHPFSRFETDLNSAGGYDFAYTFIEPNFGRSFFSPQPPQPGLAAENLKGPTYKGGSSQHPEDDPSGGEGLMKAVYEAIRNSPLCERSLLIIVYDEHGGFYDSVRPGKAVPPGDAPPAGQTTLNECGFDFGHYGARVPAVIVSPLVPRGTVDHTVYDHTSILATVERLAGLPSLTRRDEYANPIACLAAGSPPRTDCPRTLVLPARETREPDSNFEGATDFVASGAVSYLPLSGNAIGFLQVLLKTELECCDRKNEGSGARAQAIERFKKIRAHDQAQEFAAHVWNRMAEMSESR